MSHLFFNATDCASSVARLLILAAILSGAAAWGQTGLKPPTESELRSMAPSTPNPYLAYLPAGVEPDYRYWNARMKSDAAKRAQSRVGFPSAATIGAAAESEPNNSQATADLLATLGLAEGDDQGVNVSGAIGASATPVAFITKAEDNGSITLASEVAGLVRGGAAVSNSQLGNGPHGSAGTGNGDFDFFTVTGVLAGDLVTADISTIDEGATFDSFVSIWSAAGELLDSNDDEDFTGGIYDSLLTYSASAAGTYYVCVGAFASDVPGDPFDSSTGPGSTTEGSYTLTLSINGTDTDHFSFDLESGDILGVNLAGGARSVALLAPDGTLLIGSSDDASFIYPLGSPLPGGGVAVAHYIAPSAGRYALRIVGPASQAYSAQLRLFRSMLEAETIGTKQILFVDFNGATIDVSIFGGTGTRVLSPLSAFLAGWGLTGQESAVIDSILASITENLRADMLVAGNPYFDIEVRNSRDHVDPFGQPNVSRLIIGGTIAQSGIETIGIAETIDPGNFDTTESALILLDLLSAPASDPNSLNQYALAGGATRLDVVGVGVGNIAAHEAGHYFGNFHTDNTFTPPNIMDQGGNLDNTVGVGNDTIFGSDDDIDTDFGEDLYIANEGFSGTEDTLSVVAFCVTTNTAGLLDVFVDFGAAPGGDGTLDNPFNALSPAAIAVTTGRTIHVYPGTTAETFTGGGALDRSFTVINQNPGGGLVRIGLP